MGDLWFNKVYTLFYYLNVRKTECVKMIAWK